MPTTREDLKKLTILGQSKSDTDSIEVFPNHAPGKMTVTLECREFTCRCPLTGQPDFATLEINYVPNEWLAETKSVKLFLERYRDVGIFHEHFAVELGQEFIRFVQPYEAQVKVRFNVRGGISVSACYSWPERGESSSKSD